MNSHPLPRPTDRVRENFLRTQWTAAQALAAQSDLISLQPVALDGGVPDRGVVSFYCTSLLRNPDGAIVEGHCFDVGFWFSEDYLRRADPRVVTLLQPWNVWHPNIRFPAICLGHILPGTPLVDLIYQVFDILAFNNWAAADSLHADAAQWARGNQHRFPTDSRPLKWRAPARAAAGGRA